MRSIPYQAFILKKNLTTKFINFHIKNNAAVFVGLHIFNKRSEFKPIALINWYIFCIFVSNQGALTNPLRLVLLESNGRSRLRDIER